MTAKNKSERLRRLLSHGYFAPELPPCFVSEDLARFRKSILDAIDALPQIQGRPASHRFTSEPCWFYFPRFNKENRRHGVPNPVSYLLLARVIADNYVPMRRLVRASSISASPPIFDWSGARALLRPSIDLRDDFRVDLASRREEFVNADIRAFFHSIYTHAIPWAIHTKPFAKQNRGMQHYGNLIDLLCRNGQDGQTIGLPVGPDCSRLIAEVVASAIDAQMQSRTSIGSRDASRYIDDFTLSSSEFSAEQLIAELRQAAAHFELELNNDKTAVISTAVRQESGWKQEVRSYIPAAGADDDAFLHFFYRVGRICEAHPDINVEKYALQNARLAFVRAASWPKIQNHLVAAYRRNTSLVAFLVEVLILRQAERADVQADKLAEFLTHRLPVLAQENRSGEVIWLLFLALRLQITLPASGLSRLSQLENSMVALLVNACDSRGLIEGRIDYNTWNRFLTADGLRSPMWLYAYESVGSRLNQAAAAFIEQDPYFSLLHAKRVRFLAVENGLTSISDTLRTLRGDNSRVRRLRDDFLDDFDIEQMEFDDEDAPEVEIY